MNNKNKRLTTFFITILAVVSMIAIFYKDVANNLTLGLDLQGGFEILYEVSPLEDGKPLPDMAAVAKSINKRVDVLGVSEPQIVVEGVNRVRVQLAGIADQEQARRMISATANLTFRDINDNLLADATIVNEGGATLGFQEGKPIVSLKIADKAKFAEITQQVSAMGQPNNLMITWLDFSEGDSYVKEAQAHKAGQSPKYISAAQVTSRIDGDCVISGNFTEKEARELADLINSGSLPVKMTEISSDVVSAEYGLGAFEMTKFAGAIGVLLVISFMIFQYRLPGIVSSIMLVIYLSFVFGMYSVMGAVFTLPGIAALVLGVGMTVDANIITFERIKEELYKGRSISKAVKEGQSLSITAVLDAQLTTLWSGVIMYMFGNGPVKGFATMLIVTVVATLLINVFVSRFLLNLLVDSGICDNKVTWFNVKPSQVADVTKNEKQFYFGPVKPIDFTKYSKKIATISLSVITVALAMMIINASTGKGALNLGIDFASGAKITVVAPTTIVVDEVKAEFDKLGYDNVRYQASGEKVVYATMKQELSSEQIKDIKSVFKAKYGIEPGDNVVTSTVGRDLVNNAVKLTVIAWIVMLAYVAFRFKWDYAISTMLALINDVLIVMAIFAIFRLEVNIELISVILTIIGYTIDNTIVVFDRIREDLSMYPRGTKFTSEKYRQLVNSALNNTLLRCIFSSLTTVLPVICLLALGSDAIFTFTFAMFVGIISGTFSSLFLAPAIWVYLRSKVKPNEKVKKKAKKEELDEYTIPGINA